MSLARVVGWERGQEYRFPPFPPRTNTPESLAEHTHLKDELTIKFVSWVGWSISWQEMHCIARKCASVLRKERLLQKLFDVYSATGIALRKDRRKESDLWSMSRRSNTLIYTYILYKCLFHRRGIATPKISYIHTYDSAFLTSSHGILSAFTILRRAVFWNKKSYQCI